MTVSRGLEGVVANTTRLSDVIGDKGQLVYCGYDINELAGKVSLQGSRLSSLEQQTAESARSLSAASSNCAAQRELPGRHDRFHQSRAENRRADGRDAHRRFDARPLRSRDGQGSDTREINERRAQHHGEDRSHRRLFSSRSQRQIAAAGARRSRPKPNIFFT